MSNLGNNPYQNQQSVASLRAAYAASTQPSGTVSGVSVPPYSYGQSVGYTSQAGAATVPQGPPPPYSMGTPAAYYQQGLPRQTVFVHGGFDAGACFDGVAAPSIPPPPPGVAPNPAQLAALQRHNIVMSQRKDNYWTGGPGVNYSWW